MLFCVWRVDSPRQRWSSFVCAPCFTAPSWHQGIQASILATVCQINTLIESAILCEWTVVFPTSVGCRMPRRRNSHLEGAERQCPRSRAHQECKSLRAAVLALFPVYSCGYGGAATFRVAKMVRHGGLGGLIGALCAAGRPWRRCASPDPGPRFPFVRAL